MNFKDRWEKDESGNKFVFTVEMQRRLSQAGLPVDPVNLSQLNITPQQPQPQKESSWQSTPDTSSRPAVEKKGVSDSFEIQIDPDPDQFDERSDRRTLPKEFHVSPFLPMNME